MTNDLQVIHDPEIVQESPEDIWECAVSEWAAGQSQAILGQLRQARAAAAVCRVHGTSSMQQFAGEVGSSKSTVYNFAKVWMVYGHLLEDGNSSFSRRLESGALTMTQLVAATRADNPVGMIETAEEENLSSRAIEARIKEEEEPQQVERIKHTITCPQCGGAREIPLENDLGGGGE